MRSYKHRAKNILSHVYPAAFSRLGHATSAPVLCYHSINGAPNTECDPLSPYMFEAHLRYLRDHHTVVPLRAVVEHLETGKALAPGAVAITFDDGYQDNYEVAFPLLRKYGLHATMFVVTGFINGTVDLVGDAGWGPMTWSQIRTMADSGVIEIGAHTDTHRILSDLEDQAAVEEIRQSKEILQTQLGRRVDLFAYPNGQGPDISTAALKAVQEFGFRGACSTFWRTTQNPAQRYLINRVMISGRDDVEVLKQKITGRYDYIYFVHKKKAWLDWLLRRRGIWR